MIDPNQLVNFEFNTRWSQIPSNQLYIYGIHCRSNNKWYIGSSNNLQRRYIDHRCGLRGNYHKNAKLQHAYNLYGIDSFVLCLLQPVYNPTNLMSIEDDWIRIVDSYNSGFNLVEKSNQCVIRRTGKSKNPEETFRKISQANKGRIPWNKGLTGGSSSQRGIPTGRPSVLRIEVKLKDLQGKITSYPSITHAAKAIGANVQNLSRAIKTSINRKYRNHTIV